MGRGNGCTGLGVVVCLFACNVVESSWDADRWRGVVLLCASSEQAIGFDMYGMPCVLIITCAQNVVG